MAGVDPIMQGVITFGLVIVAVVGVSSGVVLVNVVGEQLRARLGKEQFELLGMLARQAVMAAEQAGLTQGLINAGAEKKHQAMTSIQNELDRRGIQLNVETIADAVEAAVWSEIKRRSGE